MNLELIVLAVCMLTLLEKILNVLGKVYFTVIDVSDDVVLVKLVAGIFNTNALSISVIFIPYGLDTVLGAIRAHEKPITAD